MLDRAKKTLKNLGLSDSQMSVYLAALELGPASIQELARKSRMKRPSVYNYIEELKEKRLIWETKRHKRSIFTAAHPSHLYELEKSRLAEMKEALPEFLAIYNETKHKPRVTFYEGAEGIKEVYTATLETETPHLSWSWHGFKRLQELLGDFFTWFPKERARRKIVYKAIRRDSPETRAVLKEDAKMFRQTKFVPAKESNTDILISDNKVILASFYSTPPFAISIEDTEAR